MKRDALQRLAEIDRDLRLRAAERRRVLAREGRVGALAVMRGAACRIFERCQEMIEDCEEGDAQ